MHGQGVQTWSNGARHEKNKSNATEIYLCNVLRTIRLDLA